MDLSNNQISPIPKKIGQLKNLRTLHLRNNPINRRPEEL
ncbi:leucine-rich repeat domain-containing protein [Leptospira stimsonii]